MAYAPVRSIIPSLKLGDYLSVQAHKPCSISHLSIRSVDILYTFITSGIKYKECAKSVNIYSCLLNCSLVLNTQSKNNYKAYYLFDFRVCFYKQFF